ncbi:hypothetical protein UFOVP117_354 [uncultured Caudovirales phage]|uniref:RNA polymerase sigma factor n=1 Tax=uncultured Caudovirales phage TaxID=2100421 RepID=A0A6J5L6P4_9CAUD|nr:hypothetical protein UFOVP117_354 [uncultured Caudovirales phage]
MTISSSTEMIEVSKKKKPTTENYFDIREENAVRMFLTASTFDEKNKIYNDFLRHPLDKMISSIIRRYKLYRKDMDFIDIHTDTHSFLMTKIDKFSPSKEKKAYSYFGTICKNYLMGQILKDQKEMNRKVSYEDISGDLENRAEMVYYLDVEPDVEVNVIPILKSYIKDVLEENDLNENEIKLGIALIEVLDNYETIFPASDNNKFNKNVILLSLREMTNLSTKEIRASMKKYKKIYLGLIEIKPD